MKREKRIRFREIKPYEVVDSLDDLIGPKHGKLTLPVRVFWSGTRDTFDFDNDSQRRQAYQAILSNGRIEHQIAFLHRERLIDDWPKLALDNRVVDLWSSHHPDLAQIKRDR